MRHQVAAYFDEACKDEDELGAAVRLAVSEAVTNAVLHAYHDRPPGDVEVRAGLEADRLVVSVRDWGSGMRVGSPNHGVGLGFPFMQQHTDSLRIRRPSDGGTEIRMSFPCERAIR